MLQALPNYQSDSDDEISSTQKVTRKIHQYESVEIFSSLEEAKHFMKQKGFSYDYRIKSDPKNGRKVN